MIKKEKIASFSIKNGQDFLFPSGSDGVRVGNLHPMQLQGLNNKIYVFSVTYGFRNDRYKTFFVLKIYGDSHEDRIAREYKALKTLKDQGIPVPTVFMLETNRRTIGAPFMIMERVDGKSASNFLNDDKNALFTVDMLAKLLASLHKLEPEILFKTDMPESTPSRALDFRQNMLSQIRDRIDIGYITSLSPFVRRRYLRALAKLEETTIQPFRPALVHCDFGPDHVLLTQKGPVIVDWEGIRMGDPAYDVGWMYHIVGLEGQTMIDHRFVKVPKQTSIDFDLRKEFLKRYEEYSGSKPANLEFYKDLVAIRLATTLDLHVRPGLASFSRMFRLRPREIPFQTILAYGTIRSFKRYCELFLRARGIL